MEFSELTKSRALLDADILGKDFSEILESQSQLESQGKSLPEQHKTMSYLQSGNGAELVGAKLSKAKTIRKSLRQNKELRSEGKNIGSVKKVMDLINARADLGIIGDAAEDAGYPDMHSYRYVLSELQRIAEKNWEKSAYNEDWVRREFGVSELSRLKHWLSQQGKHIRKEGGKFVLHARHGGRVLGKHSSKQGAIKQEQAIEISKHGGKSLYTMVQQAWNNVASHRYSIGAGLDTTQMRVTADRLEEAGYRTALIRKLIDKVERGGRTFNGLWFSRDNTVTDLARELNDAAHWAHSEGKAMLAIGNEWKVGQTAVYATAGLARTVRILEVEDGKVLVEDFYNPVRREWLDSDLLRKDLTNFQIKSSPFEGYKQLPDSFYKCMDGPNRGKPGPCPDANKVSAKKARSGGVGVATGGGNQPGIISKVHTEQRAKQEKYTEFLRDEYVDKRATFNELSRAYRENKISPEDYHNAIQDYERSRQQYVSRMGMSGLKKIAIALGVTAVAAGAAYAGYKYSGQVVGIWEKLNGVLNAAGPDKKAAVIATAALGGITTAAEALKGNSTIDPTAGTAKRVVEILLTNPKTVDPKLIAAMEDVRKHGAKAAPESVDYLYNAEKNKEKDIRDGKVKKKDLAIALARTDATYSSEDIQGYFRDLESNQGFEDWGSRDYLRKTNLPALYRRAEIENLRKFREEVYKNALEDDRSSHFMIDTDRFKELMKVPEGERTTQEDAQYQRLLSEYDKAFLAGSMDPNFVVHALSKTSDAQQGTLQYNEFITAAKKKWQSFE